MKRPDKESLNPYDRDEAKKQKWKADAETRRKAYEKRESQR